MKISLIWKILVLPTVIWSLSSCSSDPQIVINDYNSPETKLLQQKYGQLLIGEWSYTQQNETHMSCQKFCFHTDSTAECIYIHKSRELVSVQGEQVYTDWTPQWNDTIVGNWQLIHVKDENVNKIVFYNETLHCGNGTLGDHARWPDPVLIHMSNEFLVTYALGTNHEIIMQKRNDTESL